MSHFDVNVASAAGLLHDIGMQHLDPVMLRMNKHRYDAALVERVMQNLEPRTELQSEGFPVMADPVNRLLEIDATLSDWPTDMTQWTVLSAPRQASLAAVAEQLAQLRRTMANVGVAQQQLEPLGGDALDEFLQLELTQLAQEAAWQLRSLARQARRSWHIEPDAHYPDKLQAWLDRVDTLAVGINSIAPAQLRHTE